jgi:hypothetical protein
MLRHDRELAPPADDAVEPQTAQDSAGATP